VCLHITRFPRPSANLTKLVGLWLIACAYPLSNSGEELTLKQVQKNPDRYKGKGIDWRGSILGIWEKSRKTTIQLIVDDDVAFVTTDRVLKGIVKGNDIRVVGIVSGSQTYQALGGQIKTVPTTRVSYVLLTSDFTMVLR